ncbi:hypothetical protein BJX63DRAFT_444267 [Aspergillus granulosus]|uniref:Amine oxidase domain-containing protein n=1 Tax=Aspergillus granulosus TaxID=176169 RepID=A0ABR4H6Z3_9EURO
MRFSLDYGVWVYSNNTEATLFFEHFGIPTMGLDFLGCRRERVPPLTGNILLQHPYLADGWELPDPVPENFLLFFCGFVEKHNLDAAVETLTLYAQGLGNILDYPAVYVMKYFSFAVVLGIQSGFTTSASMANGKLYETAQAELGGDVLLSSAVVTMGRSDTGHRILVSTPEGNQLVLAHRLVVAIPPTLQNLANFDLDDHEAALFSQLDGSYYYTTVLNISGIPQDIQNLFTGFFSGGTYNLTEQEVRTTIRDNIRQLQVAGYETSDPEILAYGNHSPFNLFVSADAIANGFYRDLYVLQGLRRTWYTGAAWHAHDSAALWRFTERLLQRVIAD